MVIFVVVVVVTHCHVTFIQIVIIWVMVVVVLLSFATRGCYLDTIDNDGINPDPRLKIIMNFDKDNVMFGQKMELFQSILSLLIL